MIYEVKSPILGFENIKKMKLEKVNDIFMRLSDEKESGLSFTLVNPFVLREYDIELPDDFRELLDIEHDSKIEVYNIMIVQNPIENSTVNFLAPLVFNNTKAYLGQIILDNSIYKNYSIIDKLSNYLSKD